MHTPNQKRLKERGFLRTRDGKSLYDAEHFIRNASLDILGRRVRDEELVVHVSQRSYALKLEIQSHA